MRGGASAPFPLLAPYLSPLASLFLPGCAHRVRAPRRRTSEPYGERAREGGEHALDPLAATGRAARAARGFGQGLEALVAAGALEIVDGHVPDLTYAPEQEPGSSRLAPMYPQVKRMAYAEQSPRLRGPINEHASALAHEWRRLTRAATAVALLTAPAFFLVLFDTNHLSLLVSVIGTVIAVLVFRGLVEVIARKLIPSPACTAPRIASRRTTWWRGGATGTGGRSCAGSPW